MGVSLTRRIVLCADDYAQNTAISDGILQLLERKRLTAISCMTDSPCWEKDAVRLKPYSNQADIGLHFNLTHAFDLPSWTLPALLCAAFFRTLDRKPIEASLQRQLNRFEEMFGEPPDFLDGHQHVHAFPVIRDIVFRVLADRYPSRLPYLRNVSHTLTGNAASAKSAVLRVLAWNFDSDAKRAGFRISSGFAGLYSLSPKSDFANHMRTWLAGVPDDAIIMCHPGFAANDPADPSAKARPSEFTYLNSEAFLERLTEAGVELSRFRAAETI